RIHFAVLLRRNHSHRGHFLRVKRRSDGLCASRILLALPGIGGPSNRAVQNWTSEVDAVRAVWSKVVPAHQGAPEYGRDFRLFDWGKNGKRTKANFVSPSRVV